MTIKLLFDQNVPDAVVRWFTESDCDVVKVRDIMAADTADPIVAEAAIRDGRILVSWDRDFGHQKFRKPRYAELRRIGFSCSEPKGVHRLNEVKDLLFYVLTSPMGPPPEIRIAWDKIMFRDKASLT